MQAFKSVVVCKVCGPQRPAEAKGIALELAAITGAVSGPVVVVENPTDIHATGRFARFVVAFDCGMTHAGVCKVAAYRRLTDQVPALGIASGDGVSLIGPMFRTAWGGTAVNVETLSLVDVGVAP